MSSSSHVLVIGTGQLGSDIAEAFSARGSNVTGIDRSSIDITDMPAITGMIRAVKPEIVVNTAALHDVDRCELDPDLCHSVNADGARHVADAAQHIGATCIYISTDYVFGNGASRPLVESDIADPLNEYGRAKLRGEDFTLSLCSRGLVVRVASLFGTTPPKGKRANFIESILEKARADGALCVVDDIVMSPTYTRDAAELILALVESRTTGIVHGTNSGACTWFELAAHCLARLGLPAALQRCTTQEGSEGAQRPRYSALASERLPAMGLTMRNWQAAVDAYLTEAGHIEVTP